MKHMKPRQVEVSFPSGGTPAEPGEVLPLTINDRYVEHTRCVSASGGTLVFALTNDYVVDLIRQDNALSFEITTGGFSVYDNGGHVDCREGRHLNLVVPPVTARPLRI